MLYSQGEWDAEDKFNPIPDYWQRLSETEMENGFPIGKLIRKEISLPNPPAVSDISVEEAAKIIQMIAELKSPEGIEEVEEVDNYIFYYIELLEKSIPHDNISDLIYWCDVAEYEHEPSAREIAEKAFETKEIK